jgi:hypothetical protein
MKEQTAVEWLFDELKKFGTHIPKIWFEQAKEMENEQKHYEYMRGWYDGLDVTK